MLKKNENVVAIIQARNNSSRLTDKVMKVIKPGTSLLDMVINSAMRTTLVDVVVVATTENESDDCLVKYCNDKNIEVFRGSEKNVLERYYKCSDKYNASVVVRITADDPFKDPNVNNRAISILLENNYDYVSNTLIPTFPEGLDVEVFTHSALEQAYSNATLDSETEHVTPYIWKNKGMFNIHNFEHTENISHFRWTIDYEEDLNFIRNISKKLDFTTPIIMNDVLKVLRENPEIIKVQKKIIRNEGYIKSLSEDVN